MKNYEIKHQRRDKAIKMFLAGAKKEIICKKFEIPESVFDEWVDYNDVKQFRRKTAFKMFNACVPDDKICRLLGIGTEKLYKWVKAGYEKEKNQQAAAAAMKKYKNGLSPWVTEICKSAILH